MRRGGAAAGRPVGGRTPCVPGGWRPLAAAGSEAQTAARKSPTQTAAAPARRSPSGVSVPIQCAWPGARRGCKMNLMKEWDRIGGARRGLGGGIVAPPPTQGRCGGVSAGRPGPEVKAGRAFAPGRGSPVLLMGLTMLASTAGCAPCQKGRLLHGQPPCTWGGAQLSSLVTARNRPRTTLFAQFAGAFAMFTSSRTCLLPLYRALARMMMSSSDLFSRSRGHQVSTACPGLSAWMLPARGKLSHGQEGRFDIAQRS